MSKPPAPSNEQVAAAVDQAIKASGYSVNQAAQLSHVPRPTLERKLAVAGTFDVSELARLARILGTKVSDLMAAAEQSEAA